MQVSFGCCASQYTFSYDKQIAVEFAGEEAGIYGGPLTVQRIRHDGHFVIVKETKQKERKTVKSWQKNMNGTVSVAAQLLNRKTEQKSEKALQCFLI